MRGPRIAFAVVFLSLAIAVAAEAVLRALQPAAEVSVSPVRELLDRQVEAHRSVYVAHPELGALLAPSQQVEVNTPDYRYTFRTDRAGFPNLEPWPAQIDIAVLGNSLITGAGVGCEGQFTTLLQQALGGRTVLNFGIPGGGTEHQLRTYRLYAAPLRPRLVIATVWLTWEIDNSVKFAAWQRENPRPDFTEFRRAYDPTYPSGAAPKQTAGRDFWNSLRRLLKSSYLLRAIHEHIKSMRGIREPVEQVVLGNGDVIYLSARDQTRLMSSRSRPNTPDIREMFFAPLETLKAEVEAAGGTLLVALFPSKEELYAAKELPEVLRPIEEARVELETRGIAVFDLYPVFQESAASRPSFFPTDMHMNQQGHQLVADALSKSITQQGVFSPVP